MLLFSCRASPTDRPRYAEPVNRYVRNVVEYPNLAALLRVIEAEHVSKET
ncbi:hypothetical protein [Bradyrhizobium yuanmingense]|nr:hypothetical protein [Bradyrhizobium yuanmingense]MDF0583909.1 hypothetical protein [Bradyrhizobium yuanmingense]